MIMIKIISIIKLIRAYLVPGSTSDQHAVDSLHPSSRLPLHPLLWPEQHSKESVMLPSVESGASWFELMHLPDWFWSPVALPRICTPFKFRSITGAI